jgi:hypothetical protein
MVFRASEKWAPREQAFVAEWVTVTFPGEHAILRARVGSPPAELVKAIGEDAAQRQYKPWLRWVDALVLRRDQVVLVEAKLRGNPASVSQLEFYADLFRKTVEHREHWTKPRRLVLLTPWRDPDLEGYAKSKGVDVVLYQPSWLEDYVAMIQGVQGPQHRARRDAALRLQEE